MKPKEKAKDLMEKMQVIHYTKLRSRPEHKGIPVSMHHDQVKQCALICIKEKIDELQNISDSGIGIPNTYLVARLIYLKETEQEIEKL